MNETLGLCRSMIALHKRSWHDFSGELAARRIGELVPSVQGKRTDKELSRDSAKFPDHQRLSEFRKLGGMLRETQDKRPKGKRTDLVSRVNQVDDTPTLADLGLTKRESSEAEEKR